MDPRTDVVGFEAFTTDFHKFKKELKKFDLEIKDEKCFLKCGYEDLDDYLDETRCVAYKFDIDESRRKIYILTANGDDRYGWDGKVLGVFYTKGEVKKYIIAEEMEQGLSKEDVLDDFQSQDCQESFMSLYDSTFYDWFSFNLSKILKEGEQNNV